MYLSSTKKHKMKKKKLHFHNSTNISEQLWTNKYESQFHQKKKEKKKNEEGMNHNHPNLAYKNQQLYNKKM